MEATDHYQKIHAIAIERVLANDSLDLREQDAVFEARADGESWHQIGLALGITSEGARQRHGKMES